MPAAGRVLWPSAALAARASCSGSRDQPRRSLGRYAILWQIEETRRLGLDAVYLGYWIKNCRKMNYKTEYRPLEMLVNQRWIRLN
mgnify:CR=1 FL=1